MDDNGVLLQPVAVHILHAETLRQLEVDLDCDQRVLFAVDVANLDIELRPVEGRFAVRFIIRHLKVVENFAHHVLRAFPILFVADVLILVVFVPFAEAIAHVVRKTEGIDHEFREVETAFELLFHLIGTAGKVAFRNRELPEADEPVHLAAALVSKERARFVIPQRQVAIGTRAVEVRHKLERAGHGTQREHLRVFVLDIRRIAHDEHAVAIVIPVTGDFIQLALCHKRRLGEQIAALLLFVLDEALQQLDHARAFRQQDRQTLTDDIHGGKEFQLAAQLVVVALFCFFQRGDVCFEVGFLFKRRAVDALEHLVLLAAAPVCARDVEELDVLHHARALDVRARAEVDKVALTVEADDRVRGQVADELDLVRLTELIHIRDGFLAGQLKALDFLIFLLDLCHLGLNFCEVFRREGFGRVKIVIEAVFDRGADGELRLRPEALDRLCEHVARRVTVGPATVFVLKGIECDLVVAVDGAESVAVRAVDGAGQRGPRKARADFVRDFEPRQPIRKFALVPVWKCDDHLDSPPVSCAILI